MLKRLNGFKRRYRWPIKWVVLGVTLLLVCYPYPHLFLRHLQRWGNPNALIDADAPCLAPLVTEFHGEIGDTGTPREVFKSVERYVAKRIRYAFDWDTWGVVDYLPTVDEVLARGCEDCDGRAVVAASLMRNLGYRAELVTDFTHVWVKTDHGEYMGPRPGKAVVVTDRGLQVNWGWELLSCFSEAIAYGVAVFPMGREGIVLLVAWLMLIGPRTGRRAALAAGLLLLAGWLLLRPGGHTAWAPIRWMQFLAVALLLAGVVAGMWPTAPKDEC